MRPWRAQDPVAKLVTFVLNLLPGAGMGEPGLRGSGQGVVGACPVSSPRLDPGSPQSRAQGCWMVPTPCPSLSSSRVLVPRRVRVSGLLESHGAVAKGRAQGS